MGITFDQLQKRLIGAINAIPAASAGEIINAALREIYDDYDWGFLYEESYIRTPALIEGTASVTKYQAIITVDATIQAKLNMLVPEDVGLEERQVRLIAPKIHDRSLTYNIIAYDGDTGNLILDKPFLDETNSAARIQILKIYYTAPFYTPPFDVGVDPVPDPVIDFRRFESMISPQFQRRLYLDRTLTDLDRVDARRDYYLGETKAIVASGKDSAGNQLFEFYPIPRQERILKVKYLRKGRDLVNPNELAPETFSKELILSKAKQKGYEWCLANAHLIKDVGNPGRFANLIALSESPNSSSSYPRLLATAKKRDEELFPQSYLGDFYIYPYYDDFWYGEYDPTLPHDRFGETLVIDATAPTIEIDI